MMNQIKSKIIPIVGFIVWCCNVHAINVSVTTQMFKAGGQDYIELYSRIISNSVQYNIIDSTSQTAQSNIVYSVILSSNDQIFIAEKYKLNSPISIENGDYFDMKRFSLDQGTYELKLEYVDLNNLTDTLSYSEAIVVDALSQDMAHSDVLLMADLKSTSGAYSFEKAGFYYEPLCFDLIGTDDNALFMYLELYNYESYLNEDFYIKYQPYSRDEGELKSEIRPAYKKIKPENAGALLLEYDCKDLASGNYVMDIAIHKKDKTLIKNIQKTFSVYHPLIDYKLLYNSDSYFESSFVQLLDKDELNYGLKAIYPRIGNDKTEILNHIIKSKDLKVKRYFLFNYWNKYSDDPKSLYNKYMEVVKAIDVRYANNVGHGFESDRGYFFLKYGRPDNIVAVDDEPSAPPYEIWIYNYMPETQETNVKFLFYNPSLVANDFQLLHSTCRGERQNPRWEVDLYIDDTQGQTDNYLEARTTQDNFGRNARRYFSDL